MYTINVTLYFTHHIVTLAIVHAWYIHAPTDLVHASGCKLTGVTMVTFRLHLK